MAEPTEPVGPLSRDAAVAGGAVLPDGTVLPAAVRIAGTLSERLGIELVEASADRVVATMPVTGNTQPYGLLHGGASCVLAETLGSIGAVLHALRTHGGTAVGADLRATHHRPVRAGQVTGVATPVRLGTTVCVYEIVVTGEDGQRVCTARLTCILRHPD